VADHFADTSALAKRYNSEVGSTWLRGLLAPATGARTFIVRTTAVELVSAVTRRERSGSLSQQDAVAARAAIVNDLKLEYEIVEVTEVLGDVAMAPAEAYGLRGYDAIQLAAAAQLNSARAVPGSTPLLFLSSDAELLAAAIAEGLKVDDPNAHP